MSSREPESRNLSAFLGVAVGVVMGITTAVIKSNVVAGLMMGVLLGVMVWSVVRRLESRVNRSRRKMRSVAPVKPCNSPPDRGGKRRAMIIDDDQVVCQLAKLALQEMGWEADWEDNGGAAIERYRQEGPFDVVLVDYVMPTLNGAETMREIRSLDAGARFVLISGMRREEMPDVDFTDSALVFLTKPFDLAQLEGALARVLPPSK